MKKHRIVNIPPDKRGFLFQSYFLSLWYENTFNHNTNIDRDFKYLRGNGYEQICFDGSYGNCDSSICLL